MFIKIIITYIRELWVVVAVLPFLNCIYRCLRVNLVARQPEQKMMIKSFPGKCEKFLFFGSDCGPNGRVLNIICWKVILHGSAVFYESAKSWFMFCIYVLHIVNDLTSLVRIDINFLRGKCTCDLQWIWKSLWLVAAIFAEIGGCWVTHRVLWIRFWHLM